MSVQSDGRPVGMLNVFVTKPRPGREELMTLGAFAALTAELVRTGVELISRNLEVAQLRQALASRVWIEQAKGMVAATGGVTLDQAFQQLRRRARAASRKLADVAQEVIQEVQRERLAPRPWTTPGYGRPRPDPSCRAGTASGPEPGWPNVPRSWTEPKMTPTPGAGRRPTPASRGPERLAGGWCW